MKIGIEAQRIQRKKKHGMDIVAIEIIRQLQKIDLENEYYIFVKAGEDKRVLSETPNFKVIELPGKTYADWEQIQLPKAAKKYKLDLLHCTSNTAPIMGKTPLIVTVHDIIYLEKLHFKQGTWYQKLGNIYRRWNVPLIIKKARRILTVSHFEEENIRKRFPTRSGDIYTVYNAASAHFRVIGDSALLNEARKRYQLPENFLFFLGNTDPKKNVPNVLKAYAEYRKNNVNPLELVLPDLDKGYLNDLLEEIRDPDLHQHIHLTGYVPNSELPYIYNLCKFFLYPSKRESFGIPILEAMQCGKAVITASTSSMPEIASNASLLVDPEDIAAIEKGIELLDKDDALREKLEKAGLERSAHFSWEQSARQVLLHYQEIPA
ncbi:MAG TPA: group 1 glycosyl transferase [Bacteroidetes bacterium]|nr:group 1 glycosyl transferase [Bacteroidota bacterium]